MSANARQAVQVGPVPYLDRQERIWHAFLPASILFAIVSATLAAWATWPRPALTTDSMYYLNAAENLYRGRGLVLTLTPFTSPDRTLPYTAWPPLYPILLFFARSLTGEAVSAARLVQILATALTAFPLALLAYRIAGRRMVAPVLAFFAVLRPPILVASFVWTDSVLVLLTYSSFALLVEGLRAECTIRASRRYLLCSGIAASLAMLTGYVGITVIACGLAVIIVNSEDDAAGKRTMRRLLRFGLPAIIPNFLWMLHNLVASGSIFGEEHGRTVFDLQAVILGLLRTFWTDTVTPWTMDGHPFGLVVSVLSVGAFGALVAIALFNYGPDSSDGPFARRVAASVMAAFPLIFGITVGILALLVPSDPLTTRILAPIYPAILLLAAFLLRPALAPGKRGFPRGVRAVVAASSIMIYVVQAGATVGYITSPFETSSFSAPYWRSIVLGDKAWKEEPSIRCLLDSVPRNAQILSNIPDVIALRTDRYAKFLPWADEANIEERIVQHRGAYIFIHPDLRGQWVGAKQIEPLVQDRRCESLGRCGAGYLYRVIG